MTELAPRLTTARLVLRAPTVADYPASAAMWADPAVVRFIGGRPSTAEEAWSRVLRYVGHWAALGYGFWMIEERASGRVLGELGFSDFHRAIEPGFGDTPEAGWALAAAAHGQGYAREALAAALAWADERGWARTVCMIDPGNAPSVKLATACGYVVTGDTLYKGEPTTLFARARPG